MVKPPVSERQPVLNLSGFRETEKSIRDRMESEIQRTLNKLSNIINIEELSINLRSYKQEGSKTKYSLKAKLSTEKGIFFSSSYAWSLLIAVKSLLEKLEREVIENRQKKRVRRSA